MFKGTTDEPCASSLQTRASHGTKMLSPEALAEEFGRKEWKHFMPDTGMAFRSGTVVGAAPPFPRLLFWTLNLWHQDTEQTVLAPCWAGCTRQQLRFHRNWMYYFPRVSGFSLAVGSVLFNVFIDSPFTCSGVTKT